MKQLKTKRELIGSLFIAFFLVGLLIPASILNGYSEIDNFTETQPTNLIDPVINDQQTESVNLDTWYLGESVKSDIEFSSQIPDESTLNYNADMQITDFQSSDIYRALSTGTWKVDLFFTARTVITEADIHFKVYCGGSGTLTIETGAKYGSGGSIFGTATGSDSESITSDDLDSLGYLYIQLRIIVHPGTEYITIYAWYYETGDYTLTQLFTATQDLGGITSHDQIQFNFDDCYFTRDTITNYVRSEYQYSSATTISHRLEIPSIRHAKELNVYYPESWSYSSINPYASVTDSSYTLTVNSPTELNYYLLFSSTSTNLLAVKDISTDYLTDVGFEKGTKDDLSNVVTSPFDSFTISTDIVSEGYYSLKGVDTEGTIDIFNFNIDYRGGVYFSFDYYLISGYTWADMYIYYRIDDSTWAYLNLTFGSSERWNKAFVYFELLGWDSGNNRNIVLQFSSGQGTVYIDNLRFFQTSTTIETLEPDKYQISSTLRSWDGYQNPVVPNTDLRFYLGDRGYPTDYITHYQTQTNALGVGTWLYNTGLDLKEYELHIFSGKNHWNPYFTKEVCIDLDSWEGVGQEHYAESYNSETDELEFVLRDTSGFSYLKFVQSPYINFYEDLGFMIYELKTNDTGSSYNTRHYSYQSPYTGVYRINDTAVTYWSDEYKQMVQHMDYWRFEGTSNFDASYVYFMLHEYYTANDHVLFTIRDFHFSHAVKTCFIPSYAYQTDYAETELNDAWDFSEGDTENIKWHINTPVSLTNLNGQLHIVVTAVSSNDFYLSWDPVLYPNGLNYDTFIMRVKTNVSASIRLVQYSGGYKEYSAVYVSGDETFSYETSSLAYQSDMSTYGIRLRFRIDSGSFQIGDYFDVDFIQLIREDDPVLFDAYYWFYLSSSGGTNSYNCYSDNNFLGVYSDLEPIAVNNSIGTHNFTYVLFTAGTEKAFIPVTYEVIYYNPESNNYYIDIAYSYDLLGSLNILLLTYWGNQTLDIWDNSTKLLDDQPEGDITTLYTVEEGYHNITIEVYNSASLVDSFSFGFYIVILDPIANYYLDLGYDYDLFGSLNILLFTYWGNQTLDIYDNSTLLVNDSPEGDITTLYTVEEGYHNITIEVYNSASLWDTLYFGFYIVIPDPIENYYLDLGYNYDLSGSLNIWVFTLWGNLTVDIFDNSTQLVDGVLEGDITTFYIVSEGYHNITVDLYNGASLWDSLEFGFIISSSIEIYTVHLDLFDQGGLGIPFEKVKCYMDSINDTNRLSQDFLTLDQNFTLYVTDYFNVTLTYFDVTLNYTLSTNYVDVEILLYQAQFTNRYNFAVTLQIIRNYHSHSFVLIANQTIAFWLTEGTYNITASALVNDEYESYSGSWTTTSEIKHYRVYLDPKPTTTKKPINIVAFVVFIVQAGAIAGGLTFAYMNIFKPLKKEFFGFSLKSAFKHKKGQTWTTIIIAVIAIAMGGLYTLGG